MGQPDSPAWRVVPTARAQRDLARLPEKGAAAVFEFVDGPLRGNPYRLGKELRGPLAGLRSARRGSFRVIYRLAPENRTITVTAVLHRRDAYRHR